MKQKSPQQLQSSINFYRVLSVILIAVIVYIGMSNMNYADQVAFYKAETNKAVEAKCKAEQDFKDALCLPRLYQ